MKPTKLPPANEICQVYVFTSVCHSVHGGGEGGSASRALGSASRVRGGVHPEGRGCASGGRGSASRGGWADLPLDTTGSHRNAFLFSCLFFFITGVNKTWEFSYRPHFSMYLLENMDLTNYMYNFHTNVHSFKMRYLDISTFEDIFLLII